MLGPFATKCAVPGQDAYLTAKQPFSFLKPARVYKGQHARHAACFRLRACSGVLTHGYTVEWSAKCALVKGPGALPGAGGDWLPEVGV